MEPKKNRYPKPCDTCNIRVLKGEGYIVRERGYWITYCKLHRPYTRDEERREKRSEKFQRRNREDGFSAFEKEWEFIAASEIEIDSPKPKRKVPPKKTEPLPFQTKSFAQTARTLKKMAEEEAQRRENEQREKERVERVLERNKRKKIAQEEENERVRKERSKTRKLTSNGYVFIGDPSRQEAKLARAFPKAKWDKDKEAWKVSLEMGDRRRVLYLADRLELEVPEELKEISLTPQAKSSKEAGLYDFQIEGVNFLSLREKALLADDMGTGKAQTFSTLIATPTKFKPAIEIQVGDEVIGQNGKPCKVLARYIHYDRDFYKVKFTDNTSMQVCEDHLWSATNKCRANRVLKRKGSFEISDYQVLSTKELSNRALVQVNKSGKGRNYNYFIPVVEPVQYEEKNLPIDPYILGLYLGDGSSSSAIEFTINEEDLEVVKNIGKYFEDSVTKRKRFDRDLNREKKAYSIKPYGENKKKFIGSLKEFGLHGKLSIQKFIPQIYKYGSIEQRWQLLCGLMDADGTVTVRKNGKKKFSGLSYSSSSYKLVHGIRNLVQSLGGIAKIGKPEYKTYDLNGEKLRTKNASWRVGIKFPGNKVPFTSSRQLNKWVPYEKYSVPYKNIESITYVGKKDGICFTVDEPNNLYVAQHYIVAHNTIQAIRALSPDDPVIIITPACVKFNWEDELHKWAPHFEKDKIKVISGRGNFVWPRFGVEGSPQIIIINYDVLPEFLEPVKRHPKDPSWKTYLDNVTAEDKAIAKDIRIIVDECHMVRNGRTFRAKRVNGLVKTCKSIWALSGTPLLNNPGDLWGMLCNLGMAWDVFTNFKTFRSLYNARPNKWGGVFYGKPDSVVPELLRRVMLRRLRHEVLPELPSKIYKEMKVSRIPKDLKKELDAEFGKWGPLLLANEMPPFNAFSGLRKALAASRIPAMLEYVEICESQDCPLLVFSAHRGPVLETAKRDGWEAILGDTSPKKRRDIVKRFQDGELKGVALTIQAGGVGLTLTRAWKILFLDLDWTPAMNSQAEDRVARIGQTADKVEIIRMFTDHPLDIHVLKLISKKTEVINNSIENELKLNKVKSVSATEESEEDYEKRIELINKVVHDSRENREEASEQYQKGLSGAKLNKYREILCEKVNKGKKLRFQFDPILYENVRDAFLYMRSICDGAAVEDSKGFNRPDAHIAKHIENFGIETEEGMETAYYLMTSYPGQLKEKFPKIFKKKRMKKEKK